MFDSAKGYVSKKFKSGIAQAAHASRALDKSYKRSRLTAGGGGKLVGRFSAPRKPQKSAYLMRGYASEREVQAQEAQAECLYIGFRSVVHKEVGDAIGIAVGRYLLKLMVHADFYDENQLWPVNTAYASTNNPLLVTGGSMCSPRVIQFIFEDNSSAPPTDHYVTWTPVAGTSTLRLFGEWFNTNILQVNETSSGKDKKLAYCQWYEPDLVRDGASDYAFAQRFGGKIALDGLIVTAYSHVDVKIQNTTSSDGLSKDKHQIDANPIKGKIFCFSKPFPTIRDTGMQSGVANNAFTLERDANNDGVILPAVDLTGSWRSVPDPSAFKHCTGVASVFLQPGQIKTFSLHFKFNGFLNKWSEGIGLHTNDQTKEDRLRDGENMWGTCKLLVLEKAVATGTSNDVECNYHMDVSVGAMVVRRITAPMNKAFRNGVSLA
jgi:hypothetical protein